MMRQARRKYLRVAHHVLADRGDAHHRDAAAQARVDEPGHVVDRARLVLAADEDLDADAGGVEPDRVVHVHRDLLVGELLRRMLGPPLARSTIGFCEVGRDDRAQDAARAEQRVAVGQQRHDRQIDALEPGGRALEVAVVDRQHHGAARRRVEGAREAVLHAPVELVRALQEEARRRLRLVGVVAFTFLVGFRHVTHSRTRCNFRKLATWCASRKRRRDVAAVDGRDIGGGLQRQRLRRNACATSSAVTSRPSRLPLM